MDMTYSTSYTFSAIALFSPLRLRDGSPDSTKIQSKDQTLRFKMVHFIAQHQEPLDTQDGWAEQGLVNRTTYSKNLID